MSSKTLIQKLAETADISQAKAKGILEQVGSAVQSALQAGEEVTLPGVGKLKTVERAARTGRNPATGGAVEIPAKTVVKFGAAKALTDAVN